MPAHNEFFPWMSYYGHYKFFEDRMNSHSNVLNIQNYRDGLYKIDIIDGRSLIVFICECYSFGMAEYYESVENLGILNAIVINSNWCGYDIDLKRFCFNQRVGLFDISGFMAALNHTNYWEYLTDSERKHFKEKGWI